MHSLRFKNVQPITVVPEKASYLYPSYEKVSEYEKCVAELAKFSIDKFTQDNNMDCVAAINHILKRIEKAAVECNQLRVGPNNGQISDSIHENLSI